MSFKGTIRPDWICMRVVPLESPTKPYNQPVGNTWQIPWQTPWASWHAPSVLPHLVPWIRDCHSQSSLLHSHDDCRCLPSRWYWRSWAVGQDFFRFWRSYLRRWHFSVSPETTAACTPFLLCKMLSGRAVSICFINSFSSTHFMFWSESGFLPDPADLAEEAVSLPQLLHPPLLLSVVRVLSTILQTQSCRPPVILRNPRISLFLSRQSLTVYTRDLLNRPHLFLTIAYYTLLLYLLYYDKDGENSMQNYVYMCIKTKINAIILLCRCS